MLCPNCQFENPEQSLFCVNCGSSLKTVSSPVEQPEPSSVLQQTQEVASQITSNKPSLPWPMIFAFVFGGPITGVIAFLVWKTSWSKVKKLFVIILLSVLINILLLGFIGWSAKYLTANIKPKENLNMGQVNPSIPIVWQTYTDSTFGYSLQYPANWKVETIEKDGNIRISNPDKYDKSTKFSFEAIEIDPYNQWNIKTPIPTWIDEQQRVFQEKCGPGSLGCGGGSPDNLIKKTTIDNKLAYKVSSSNVLGTHIEYLIPYKQTVYSLRLYKDKNNETDNFDEDGSKLATIFQKILSSFKFTK